MRKRMMGKLRKMSKAYYLRQIVACLLVYCILLAVPAQVVQANPDPPDGAHPSTLDYNSISGTAITIGNTTTITAPDNGTVFDWENFDIGIGHIVEHLMEPTDAVLHRINVTPREENGGLWGDGDATGIKGNLSAPGYLFVVNPMGIVIGSEALITANRFVASGLNISNFTDFINGVTNELQFDGYDPATLGVQLMAGGEIDASAVALVGKTVINNGTIISGSVVLAAGERVYLAVTEGSGNLVVDVTDLSTPAPIADHSVYNAGTIDATGGNVLLAAGDIYSNAISGVENLAAEANRDIILFDNIQAGEIGMDAGQDIILAVDKTMDSDGMLTLKAERDISLLGRVEAGGAGDVSLTTISGNVMVTDVRALDDQITINSGGAILEYASGDSGDDLTAATLSLTAITGISGQSPIETSATDITASTEAGNIDIYNTNGSATTASLAVTTGTGTILFSQDGDGSLDVTSATTADGSIGINVDNATLTARTVTAIGVDVDDNVSLTTTASGDVIVDDITAAGNTITINSAGAILEYNGIDVWDGAVDLTADTLDLTANDGIAAEPVWMQWYIETAANTITARTIDDTKTDAKIWLSNYNDSATSLIASTVVPDSLIAFEQRGLGELTLTDVSTNFGSVYVASEESNIVASLVNAGGPRNVSLSTTTSGDVIVDDVTAGGQIIINSVGSITEYVNDPDIDLAADTLDLTANDDIGIGTVIETAATTIFASTIDPAGDAADIVLHNYNSGPTSLTASTVGTDSYVIFTQTDGGELTLTDVSTVDGLIDISAEQGDIVATLVNAGGDDVDYNVTLTTTTSGDVFVDDVTALGNTITINSDGAIEEYDSDPEADLTADTLDLTANDGIVYMETAANTIFARTIDDTKTAAHILLFNDNSSPTSLTASTVGTNSNIDFSQRGGGELTLTDVSTDDGHIDIYADSGDIAATLVNAGGTDWDYVSLFTDNSGDITVGSVTAADYVAMDSAGSINDAEDDMTVDITAPDLYLYARDEIGGNPTAGKTDDTLGAIETDVDMLWVESWGTGGEGGGGDIVIVETDDVELLDVIAESGSIFLEATDGGMTHVIPGEGTYTIKAGASTLTMVQQDDLDLAGFTFENQANTELMVEITDGGFTADNANPANAADQWQSVQAIATDNIVLQGSDLDEDIKIGLHEGFEPITHPFGGVVESSDGGVSIISENNTVRTADDAILDDVTITGTSDDELGTGVDLPYGPGKAAIKIMGAKDLILGENTTLTASGTYDSTGVVDDREGVGFLDVRAEMPEGYPRYEGDPFDAAIYLASTEGDVEVSSLVSITSYETDGLPDGYPDGYPDLEPVTSHVGAMIIDAFDSVTFGEAPGSPFEVSLANGEVGDRLEVVSRITEWLFQADGRLPYPSYPYYGGGPFPLDYTYVLRGAGLDNPVIANITEGIGRAWVLVDPDNAPLDREAGEQAQRQALGLDGCPVLLAAVSAELGIPEETIEVSLENSYALNTDIQPCESCARLIDAAVILRDEDGSRMAAMNQVFNELAPADAPLTPEVMASIVTAFAGHINDGTQYATALEYIDAFVQYIAVLNSDIGSPVGDSIAYVIEKYGQGLTESENNNMAAFVASRLQSGETFSQ